MNEWINEWMNEWMNACINAVQYSWPVWGNNWVVSSDNELSGSA